MSVSASEPVGTWTDAEVVAASVRRPEAFAALYDRHAATLYRYLDRRVPSLDAEDLVSEVFATAFRLRGRYDPARPDALPWLYGIATNLLHRHRRSERTHYRLLARTGVDPLEPDHAEQVALRVTAGTQARAVAAALAGLTAKERDVLLLVAWAGLDHEGVSTALGIPPGTVRSRLNRARTRLRAALGDAEGAIR